MENAIEFLVKLYHTGIGYSATNTARSALSTILTLDNNTKLGEHPLVTRYMKGIFEHRPALPKYPDIWDVNVVLNYLKTFDQNELLPLKELTLKLTMLLCLTTGREGKPFTDRCEWAARITRQIQNKYQGRSEAE